jgi:nicotine blue oxidoreductase
VDRAVRLLQEAGCQEVHVVLGAWIGPVPGAHIIHNAEWESGMGSSLRTGLKYLKKNTKANRVVVMLVDLPGMTTEAIQRVMQHDAPVVIATFDGKRGHPVVFNREYWKEISKAAKGDSGARKFLKKNIEMAELVECGDIADGRDLDERPE